MYGLRVKNVCLLERKKKGVELWGSVSIYRGQKTLKNRYGWLGFESRLILLQIGRKGCALSSPKGCWAKANHMKIWPYGSEHSFVFGCRLDSFSKIFWPILVPRHVFVLRLWFFISFLDNSGFFKNNYLVDKSLKINLDNVQIIPNFVVIQSSLLFLCMHPYFKH